MYQEFNFQDFKIFNYVKTVINHSANIHVTCIESVRKWQKKNSQETRLIEGRLDVLPVFRHQIRLTFILVIVLSLEIR